MCPVFPVTKPEGEKSGTGGKTSQFLRARISQPQSTIWLLGLFCCCFFFVDHKLRIFFFFNGWKDQKNTLWHTNYINSNLVPASLFEPSHHHSFVYSLLLIIHDCQSWGIDRDCMAHKTKNIYCPVLYRNTLPTPASDHT